MNIPNAPVVTLANGVAMPQLGLGTWPMDDAQAAVAVEKALGLGYRLIDTAENYGNERGVGEGLRRAGLPRAEVFVTSKFNRQWHSVDGARQACEASLARYEHRLARALAGVINILDPDVIVLGGGLSNIERLYQRVPRLWCPHVFSDHVATRLVRARHGDSSGVRGAAWLWPD